uniref:HTH psq-type domain-containing protein n=1 Tax=Timema tahoe TaxID=61484 RepID=A0A7R9NWQ3_9NEOP|nr:unnamed protein product [Timema tahoe]
MSAISGRRTYTEDELQAALRDIQSGKLGTRRAAVIYGIPRSTLRNKVYKLAMERERDSHLVAAEALKVEEDEKELSAAEEEQEVEKVLRKPLLSMEDLIRFSVLDGSGSTSDSLRALLRLHEERSGSTSPSECLPFPLDMWGGLEHSTLAPYISNLLAAAGMSNRVSHRESIPGNFAKFPNHLLPEIMRRMVTEEKILFDEHLRKNISIGPSIHLNGSHSEDEENRKNRREVIVHPKATSREDDEFMDVDTAGTAASGTATPPNVILRIPSFKPTSKNGVASGSSGGVEPLLLNQNIHKSDVASPGLVQVSSQPFCFETHSNSDSCSPPVNSLIGKGVGVSLRDVIAKSISQKFQQHSAETMLPLSHPQHKILSSSNEIDDPTYSHRQFTPPLSNTPSSIAASVIKNNNNNIHEDRNVQKLSPINKSPSSSSSTGCTSTGGKGTRPKRGKYRNYDRDSLVEAVRAVQRGEMSVHRAGSYYGVPHSTLEYKVKERHLMRPRKREPKTHIDDTKRKDEFLRMSSPDKPKLSQKPFKPLYRPSSPLSNPPNGLKMPPLFDPNMPLPYPPAPPFPFWPTNPFHSLPLSDFPRGTGGPPGFSSTHEQFYASQMMQRLQEDSSRSHPSVSPGVSCSPPIVGPGSTLGKSAREMAESLYDGTGANGSFLDGIIRSSLEMGLHAGHPKSCGDKNEVAEKMSNKALLDQLCKNSRFPSLSHPSRDGSSSDEDSSVKRLSESTFRKTDSEASMSANLDFSPSSNGSVTRDDKHPDDTVEDDDSKPVKPPSPVDNTNNSFISDDHDLKLSSKERISVGSDEFCDPTDEESACDSKQSLLKVDANNAAKDGVAQERTEEEETKIKDD